jgi:NADP-dependent 3-hydroxy acid dehydrogenase YdfG
MSEFGGRVAVVTGAGSGIGRALAVGLVQRGARVAASDVDADGLAETARLMGHGHRTDLLDVTDRAAVLAYAEAVVTEFGHVNQVYNNAGVAFAGDVLGSAFEDIERVVDIDFWGVVNGTKAFLPHLIASGDGHVVNISSLFGLLSVPGQSAYNAAKFAVRGFTESLRQEMLLAGHAVRVTCVHPGGIKTNIARNGRAHGDPRGLGRSQEEMAAEFEDMVRTTPERAAEVIHRGVDAGKARILIGADARLFDLVTRITPTHYWTVLGKLEALAERGARR